MMNLLTITKMESPSLAAKFPMMRQVVFRGETFIEKQQNEENEERVGHVCFYTHCSKIKRKYFVFFPPFSYEG